MMKQLLSLLFVLILITGNLASKAQTGSLYDELVSVNAEWKYQPDADDRLKTNLAKPLTEQQLIQFHLAETEKLLRSRNSNSLSPQQKANRMRNLDVLHQYMLAGVYPINSMHNNRQPYFIDDNNTYCAVGYLMKESGADSMARYIHQTQNFSYLKDIDHKDLMIWALQSGLTIDELALIQPGYIGDIPSTLLEFHYNNVGDDVNEYIEVHQGNGGFPRFNTILFYDSSGLLYKTLPITDMQLETTYHYAYYYLFPASDSFANSGKIEIRSQGTQYNLLLSTISYNGDSVSIVDYSYGVANSAAKIYPVGENESTPINTSLTFCGYYLTNWTLTTMPATIGTVSSCVVLPITLEKFSCTIDQNKVNLLWKTQAETNNKFFSIERSTDGYNFSEIGTVAALGKGNSSGTYNYADNNPQYRNYYRLKQVDINGAATYSKVLFAKVEAASRLIVRQTLVTTDLVYQNTSISNGANVAVYDVSGKKMFSGIAGSGTQHINVSSFASGKYFIRLTSTTGEAYTQQFIKQ